MPKNVVDYSKTIIYKIVCKDLLVTDCYVGHTTDFRKRKWQHKADVKRRNYSLQKAITQNGGFENWDMIEVEKFSCIDSNEAKARERYWYELLHCTLNGQSPLRTKMDISIEKRKYYETNKSKILQKRPSRTSEENIEYMRCYYQTNKVKLLEKQQEIFHCECGGQYNRNHKQRHFNTNLHKSHINNFDVRPIFQSDPF